MRPPSEYVEALEDAVLELMKWTIVLTIVSVTGPFYFFHGFFVTTRRYLPALVSAGRVFRRQARVTAKQR